MTGPADVPYYEPTENEWVESSRHEYKFPDEPIALFGAEPPDGLGYREAWEAVRDAH
jgi:hypothetical protein